MTEHVLKTWPEFFRAIVDGKKTFEVRKNDRGFQTGDVLHLREFDPKPPHVIAGKYTGNELHVRVTYVLSGESFGIKDGFVVMGIKRMKGTP